MPATPIAATRLEVGERRADVRRAGVEVVAEPLGHAHAAEVEARVERDAVGASEHELRRAAADVDDERVLLDRAAGRHPAKRHQRLVVPGEQLCREAVAPLDLAEERLAVLGVADGARGDGERPLGAERLQLAAEVGEAVAHPRDGEGEEAAPPVDAFAEPRDHEPPRDLVYVAVDHVGDEQARGVRPEVDRRDARQGVKKRAKRYAVLAPWTPPKSTRTRATERWRRATSRWSCEVFGSSAARRRSSSVDRPLSDADASFIRRYAGRPCRQARSPLTSAQIEPATRHRRKTPSAIQT